jgi:hypothetical protein
LKLLIYILLLLTGVALTTHAQEVPNSTIEQQLENLSEAEESETEDDNYLQQLQDYRRNPLNLNAATEADLQAFRWLTDMQIQNFLRYRWLLGKLLSVYELQAIPTWDLETINRMRPFVVVSNAESLGTDLGRRFADGTNTLLLRLQQVVQQSKAYKPDSAGNTKYLGSPQRVFVRYRHTYKNLLQFGLVGDKDAGEQFGKGAQKYGFDFYSLHLFARNLGFVRRLALGDFTVNMGQGLLTYQSLAFRKSVDVTNIKRQTEIFRPYNSAGEYNFHRGAAITVGSDRWQVSAFFSRKKIDGNQEFSPDTLSGPEDEFTSLLTGGLHRTPAEIADRYNITQTAFGGSARYKGRQLQVAVNGIQYRFNKFLNRRAEPYNQFVFNGTRLSNFSVDYGYTVRNLHIFGEVATDDKGALAVVNGAMASVDQRVDLSLFYRHIAKDYRSLNANAFTESTQPINENGLYTGISLKPWGFLRIDAYADLFKFGWLRYRVDRPSEGSDYLTQLTWKPNKQVEVYTRLRHETKAINLSNTGTAFKQTEDVPRTNWRTHVVYKLSTAITLRARAEAVWYDHKGKQAETGFLMFADFLYKPLMSKLSFNTRLQYFETDGYNSRLYAYENDVLYSFSIPPFSGQGYRGYINLNYDITRKLTTWLRLAHTLMPKETSLGSGNDEIPGKRRTDYRLQIQYTF